MSFLGSLLVISVASSVTSSVASAAAVGSPVLRNFAIECDTINFAVTVNGAQVTEPYLVFASSNVDTKSGSVIFIPDYPPSSPSGPGNNGFEVSSISHTTGPTDPQQDWQFTSADASVAVNSGTCDMSKNSCSVTARLDGAVTGGSAPTTATATCAAYYAFTIPEAISAALSNNKGVAAAKMGYLASLTARGPLWESFFPQITASLEEIRNTTATNFPSTASPPIVKAFQATATLPLAMTDILAWRAGDYAASEAHLTERTAENAAAEAVVGLYVGIQLAREQREILQDGFMEPLDKMASDPKVTGNAQLLGVVQTLITNLGTAMIGAEYGLKILDDQFRLLTGLTIDNDEPDVENPLIRFSSSDIIDAALPQFGTMQNAVAQALKSNPGVLSSQIAILAAQNADRIAKWSPFQPFVSYGPTMSSTLAIPGAPYVNDRVDALTFGVSIQFGNPFKYFSGEKAAGQAAQAQTLSTQNARDTLEGAVDKDFFTTQQQIQVFCSERAQITQTLTEFGQLINQINSGTYDPVAATQMFPLALSTLTALFGAESSAISAVADIHAQVGDLSTPKTWNFSESVANHCSNANVVSGSPSQPAASKSTALSTPPAPKATAPKKKSPPPASAGHLLAHRTHATAQASQAPEQN